MWISILEGLKVKIRMEVIGMVGLVLVKKNILKTVYDLKIVRGMGQGISNHSFVLCNDMMLSTWIKHRKEMRGLEVLRVRG